MPTLDDLLSAKTPSDLFSPTLDTKTAQKRYQRLLRIAHPDVNPDETQKAEQAFKHLNKIWETYISQNGTLHKTKNTNSIKTKKHEYQFADKRYQIDGIAYFNATYDAGYKKAFIALSTTPENNTAFVESMKKLNTVRKNSATEIKGFFPEVIDSFYFTANSKDLAAVTLETEEPFEEMFSLRDVLTRYPQGIQDKDIAWIYRRMLMALAETHKSGYVHNGLYLDSLMIHPARHGVILKDWQYAVPINEPANLLNKEIVKYYSADVLGSKPVTPKHDITLAARTAIELLTKNSIPRFRRALEGTATYPPAEAETALEEFDSLIKELWGKREWHEFIM